MKGTSELVLRAHLGRPLTSVKENRFLGGEGTGLVNKYLDVREYPSFVSVVERWEDKGAVYKNKPVEIWEFVGGLAGESTPTESFQNESNISSDVGSSGKDLVG